MSVHLTDKLLHEIQYDLDGTCRSLGAIIDEYDLDISEDDLKDRLLDGDHPIERSVCCEWWFSPSVLEFDDERNGGVCESCEPEFHQS